MKLVIIIECCDSSRCKWYKSKIGQIVKVIDEIDLRNPYYRTKLIKGIVPKLILKVDTRELTELELIEHQIRQEINK